MPSQSGNTRDIVEARVRLGSGGGLRPTRQRLSLARLLVGDGLDRHVTAEGLFGAAQVAGEAVSLATVYNTLKAFCDAGLIHEITMDGARSCLIRGSMIIRIISGKIRPRLPMRPQRISNLRACRRA